MEEQAKITEAQYESIIKRLDTMQKTQDLHFEEWNHTTKNVTDLEVRMKTVEAKVDGARDDIEAGNKQIVKKVNEHLSCIPDMICDSIDNAIADNLEHKKVIMVKGTGLFKKIWTWLRSHLGI